jgi:hypothetical protein
MWGNGEHWYPHGEGHQLYRVKWEKEWWELTHDEDPLV